MAQGFIKKLCSLCTNPKALLPVAASELRSKAMDSPRARMWPFRVMGLLPAADHRV